MFHGSLISATFVLFIITLNKKLLERSESKMKYIFASDIHGSVDGLKKVIEIFNKEGADNLVLLGDTASSMDKSDNLEMAGLLNAMKEKVELIRGNCDTLSFEDMLDFEMYDIDTLYINSNFVTITHGNGYNCYELPPNCGDIFIQGHTHVPMLEKRGEIIIANPGSISRPRGVDLRCYILLDEKRIVLKTLEQKEVKEIAIS